MNIQILFNSEATQESLATGWGISCLVDGHILFDTGEKGESLLNNMKVLGINPKDIDTVVISHDHWDHTGGLWDLMEQRPCLTIHTCPGFSKEFYARISDYGTHIIKHDKPASITDRVFVTGEMVSQYKGDFIAEQALVIETDRGINVISGCAHPGIIKILERVGKEFPNKPFNVVIGGFHLIKSDPRDVRWIISQFQKLGVKKAGPTHCSGKDAEKMFEEVFGADVLSANVGEIIEI